MDEALVQELIDLGYPQRQATQIAQAAVGELDLYSEIWDAHAWDQATAQSREAWGFVVGWDLAASLAGNPAA